MEVEYSSVKIKQLLKKTPVHIAYFFCHAEPTKDGVDSRLILKGEETPEERVLGRDVSEWLSGKRWQPPAFVFLNGCNTSGYKPEALSPFVTCFVSVLGASGFLGTEVRVWDGFAAEFGLRFFQAFLDGKTAGESVLLARRIMLAKRNPLGLVYTLYALSDLHLAPS